MMQVFLFLNWYWK